MKKIYLSLIFLTFISCVSDIKNKANEKAGDENNKKEKKTYKKSHQVNTVADECKKKKGFKNRIFNLDFGEIYNKYFNKYDFVEEYKCIGSICYENNYFSVLRFTKKMNLAEKPKWQNYLLFLNGSEVYSFAADMPEDLPDSLKNDKCYFNHDSLVWKNDLDKSVIFDGIYKKKMLYSEVLSQENYKNCVSLD